MSNRQARRQQSKQSRQQRQSRPRSQARTGGSPSGGGGGLGSVIGSPFVLGAVLLALVLGGIVVFLAVTGDDSGTTNEAVTALEDSHANVQQELADGFKLGQEDAPVKMVMFEDFQCPICLRYTYQFEPAIIDEYVNDGKVQLEFKNLPILGAESYGAAAAGYCAADQNRFWDYQNALFLTQARAGQLTDEENNVGRFEPGRLRDIAEEEGLDMEAYDACIASSAPLDTVNSHDQEARSYGFTGTPSFVINGVPQQGGASTVDGWREILDAAYTDATGGEGGDGDATPTEDAAE